MDTKREDEVLYTLEAVVYKDGTSTFSIVGAVFADIGSGE